MGGECSEWRRRLLLLLLLSQVSEIGWFAHSVPCNDVGNVAVRLKQLGGLLPLPPASTITKAEMARSVSNIDQ